MNKYFFVFLSTILFFVGCSKKTVVNSKSVEQEVLVKKVQEVNVKNLNFDYFNSRAKIVLDDGNNKINGKITIRIRRDSLIWVSISPGLGIEAVRAKITTDSVHVINYLEKTYQAYDFKYINQMLNMDLNYNVLQSIIVGNMPFSKQDNDEVDSDSTDFFLKQNTGLFAIDNTIEKGNMKLKKVKITEKPTKNIIDIEYKDFQPVDEEIFPYTSNISLQYRKGQIIKDAKILLNHIKAELSNKELSFPFTIPAKYGSK